MDETQPLRLNLGSGPDQPLDGFTNIDKKFGTEVYPLPYEGDTVDEIRASHILEHFSHRHVMEVLTNWYERLKPGGLIRIAVPDFKWIAEHYLAGEPIDVQQFAMGDQQDEDNCHKCAFDAELLRETMINVGFERIGPWKSEITDCATLPCSLNLQGFKPSGDAKHCENTTAILSCPRFGPMIHMRCAIAAFAEAHVPYSVMMGAYWHAVLSELMEDTLARGVEFVITSDYDTVFTYQDVMELYRLIRAHDGADAVCAMQTKRGGATILLGIDDATDRSVVQIYAADFEMNLKQVARAHFGLTIFRADTLRKHDRPWMVAKPNARGRWGAERVDADIDFWHRWAHAGHSLYLAPRVVIGHMEELVSWPGRDLRPVYQSVVDYVNNGIPAEVKR